MIDLITGLPGNAKTLYTIAFVKKWAETENRPVYYSGIPELTLDWQEIDPIKWMDCPPKSIVVIDECQKIFRNRSLGATPPKHVTDLETHRHLGIDLVFITQHPSLIDPAIRKLTQRHRHLVRAFGMEVSTVHKWDAVRDNCDKPAQRKDSEKTRWKFDKSVFKFYKSADEHTFKRSIPMRLKLLLLVPVLLLAAGYFVYTKLVPKQIVAPVAVTAGTAPGAAVLSSPVAAKPAPFDALADAKQYIAMATPRLVGLPHTAPKYDDLTKPSSVPMPAMCIQTARRCKCLTQQNTPIDVTKSMCLDFVQHGYFQDFSTDKDMKNHVSPSPAKG